MRAASLLACAVVVTVSAAGCASPPPTFALACIAADDAVIARAHRARVSVRDRDGLETLARVVALRGDGAEASFPLRIPIAPRGGDPGRVFEVAIEALDDADVVIARARARGSFARAATVVLPMILDASCAAPLDCEWACRAAACEEPEAPIRTEGTDLVALCPSTIIPALDAGPRDAGAADAPLDANLDPTRCDEEPFASAFFCDGFEAPDLSAWPERQITDGPDGGEQGSLERATDRAYRGEASFRSRTSGGGYATLLRPFPRVISSGPLHMRAYALIPSTLVPVHMSIFYLGRHRPPETVPAEPISLVTVNIVGRDVPDRLFSYVGPALAYAESPVPLPSRDEWHCLQLAVEIDDLGRVTLMVDGALVIDQGIDTAIEGGYSSAGIGIGFTFREQIGDIYLDEVAVATSPLPCD